MIRKRSANLHPRVIKGVLVFAVFCCAALPARPQAPPPSEVEEEVLLSVDVGYNTAYRDDTWVPVDVLVVNEQDDLSGFIEVRLFRGPNQVQSPYYRMPVECPRDSRKRFRLHCYLDGTTRVEAWLYENNRAAVEVPAYLNLQPIEDDDLLAVVMDNDTINYGFLYSSMQTGEEPVRFHRQGLTTATLSLLPDYPEAYHAFNLMIIGDVDITRISRGRRELIKQYVRDGGTLVVMTGAHGARYRDSWLQELMGVDIGATADIDESRLARQVFPENLRMGAESSRLCAVTELSPARDDVKTIEGDRVLAAMASLGRGRVYTLAVDAASRALQECEGYQALWREMAFAKNIRPDLNTDALARVSAQLLPRLSGVTIMPLEFVMGYLLVYFGVAIVGNWLFWSWMQRREFAWICLILFSAGFTTFALLYGSAGWGRSADVQRVEVVRVPANGGLAEYHGLVGVLSARSQTFNGELTNANFLARDGSAFETDGVRSFQTGFGFSDSSARPFYFIQDAEPVVQQLRVGASELRFVQVDGRFAVDNGFESALEIRDGGIYGTVTNRTGITLRNAFLLMDGRMYRLLRNGDEWRVARPGGRTVALPPELDPVNNRWSLRGSEYNLARVLQVLHLAPFVENEFSGLDADMGPYIVGWTEGLSIGGLEPAGDLDTSLSESLLISEVEIRGVDAHAGPRKRPLAVQYGRSGWLRSNVGSNRIENVSEQELNVPGNYVLAIRIPKEMAQGRSGELEITLYSNLDDRLGEVFLAPGGGDANEFSGPALVGETHLEVSNEKINAQTYRISNWRQYVDINDPRIVFLRVRSRLVADEDIREREDSVLSGPAYKADFRVQAWAHEGPVDGGSGGQLQWQ